MYLPVHQKYILRTKDVLMETVCFFFKKIGYFAMAMSHLRALGAIFFFIIKRLNQHENCEALSQPNI